MTTEEAIKRLEKIKAIYQCMDNKSGVKALNMAIKALEAVDYDCGNCLWYQLAQKNLDESEEEE